MADWVPLAFKQLPLMTRWLISFQSILFLLGHLVPAHPWFGASGGAVSSLGFDPIQILQPLLAKKIKGNALAFVHASLPHLLFNMYSFSSIGPRLERLVGSLGLLQVVLVLALTKSFVLLTSEVLLLWYFQRIRTSGLHRKSGILLPGPMVGFSGVIFGLITIDSLLAHPEAQVMIFAMQVPARVFPLVLLVLQWVLFPFASVWGHAGGIAAGAMLSAGQQLATHVSS
jgi:membrane associated rhomboid family serine protease